jgi:hypothetical protein
MIRKISEHWEVPEWATHPTEIVYVGTKDPVLIRASHVAELLESLQGSGVTFRRDPDAERSIAARANAGEFEGTDN